MDGGLFIPQRGWFPWATDASVDTKPGTWIHHISTLDTYMAQYYILVMYFGHTKLLHMYVHEVMQRRMQFTWPITAWAQRDLIYPFLLAQPREHRG